MHSFKKTLMALPILCSTAHAGMAVEGDKINISYGDGGTWSNDDYDQCLTYFYDGSWVDFCQYGYEWQVLSASYVVGTLTSSPRGGAAACFQVKRLPSWTA